MLCMQGALYIGGDNNFDQCVAAVDNVLFAEEMHAVHIINANVIGKLQVQSCFLSGSPVNKWWDLVNVIASL